MNKIEKGKKALIWLGVGSFILTIILIVVGIFVIINGAKSLSDGVSVRNIFEIVAGSILLLISFFFAYIGIYFCWVGSAIKATNGSIKDDDLCKGTVNMKKCKNCGSEVCLSDKVCGQCGNKLEEEVVCEKCKNKVDSSKKHCTNCGDSLKK